MTAVAMTVNGKPVTGDVDPRTLLVQFLRENLRLTGTHVGCDTSQCGACVVHIDGKAVKSCTTFAWQVQGANITTIEGLAEPNGPLHPMQEAFREHHGAAMRLLHAGHDHVGDRYRVAQGQRPRRQDHPPRARGQHLPLHRLPQHRQGDRGRRQGDGQVGEDVRRRPNLSEETAMSATGIGAAVRRKEDQRFITGKGHYTDDVNRPGQAHAWFVRSPHAHARIKIDRHQGRRRGAGRARRAHRRRSCRRQDRQSHLRLDDPFQGRLAHEDGAASGARGGQGLPRGRSGGGRGRRDAGAGEGCRREGEGRLRSAAGGRRSGQGASEGRPADSRGRARQHDLSVAPRRRQGGAGCDEFGQARHQARHRQQPPRSERDRAARRHRRIRFRQQRLHALEHDPEPACGAARDLGLHWHGARAQAARDRARRRRRFRLQDLHLSRRGRGAVGVKARRTGR